jgi:hypothetical protein
LLSIADWHFTKQRASAETCLGEAVHQLSGNIGIRHEGSQGAHEPLIRLAPEGNLRQRREIIGVVYFVATLLESGRSSPSLRVPAQRG